MNVNIIIRQFEELKPNDIFRKGNNGIKSSLKKITQKLIKIINAIAKEKGAEFTPEQKRGLISAFVKSISTDYIVLPKKAKNRIEGNNGESTKKLKEKIKSKIKEYINICTKLKGKGSELGSINNSSDFINTIEENIKTDILKIKLKKFLGVNKEDKMEKLIEIITSINKKNSSGKGLIFSIVANMAGINKPTNNSNTLYYDIISNLFISDICDLIDLCTVTKNINNGEIVNVEYIIDNTSSGSGNGDQKTILHKDNQEKLNEIIKKVVDYRTRATVS